MLVGMRPGTNTHIYILLATRGSKKTRTERSECISDALSNSKY